MKVYYLFTLCLFKVGRLFSKLAIPKYMFVFVIKLSKEKTSFMYGWTWEIEHKMYCLLLTWGSVWDSAPYFHSSVSNVNFVLWRRGPEIYPVCPDVDSMCWIFNYRIILVVYGHGQGRIWGGAMRWSNRKSRDRKWRQSRDRKWY
jgi:hypothetical protein